MLLGADATFMLHIAEARQPDGVPVPYAKRWNSVAESLENKGLIERHYVGAAKLGAFFTPAGAKVFAAIVNSLK
jgi:hypothetical protein